MRFRKSEDKIPPVPIPGVGSDPDDGSDTVIKFGSDTEGSGCMGLRSQNAAASGGVQPAPRRRPEGRKPTTSIKRRRKEDGDAEAPSPKKHIPHRVAMPSAALNITSIPHKLAECTVPESDADMEDVSNEAIHQADMVEAGAPPPQNVQLPEASDDAALVKALVAAVIASVVAADREARWLAALERERAFFALILQEPCERADGLKAVEAPAGSFSWYANGPPAGMPATWTGGRLPSGEMPPCCSARVPGRPPQRAPLM